MGTAASHSAGAAVEGCYPIICFQDAKPISSDNVSQPLNSDLNVPYVRFIGHREPLVPLRRHDTMASLIRYGYWTKCQRRSTDSGWHPAVASRRRNDGCRAPLCAR